MKSRKRLTIVGSTDQIDISEKQASDKESLLKNEIFESIGAPNKINFQVSAVSKAGITPHVRKKVNQDSYRYFQDPSKSIHMFIVCDGHGREGENVSRYITKNYPEYFHNLILAELSTTELNSIPELSSGSIISTIEKSFILFDRILLSQKFDTYYSGSTLIACFIINNVLYTANVGDSRAVMLPLGKNELKKADKSKLIGLSTDLTPNLPGERRRIESLGGKVSKCFEDDSFDKDDEAPYRVWLKDQRIPGLAMSRAMGDFLVKTIGVIADPEISVTQLSSKSSKNGVIMMASDGIWEFLNNKAVFDIVKSVSTKELDKLVAKAEKKWKKYTGNLVVDDITALFFSYSITEKKNT